MVAQKAGVSVILPEEYALDTVRPAAKAVKNSLKPSRLRMVGEQDLKPSCVMMVSSERIQL